MPRRSAAVAWLAILGVLLTLAGPTFVAAQERGRSAAAFQQALRLDINSEAIKKIGVARDHLQVGQWSEAIDLLRQIADAHGTDLVPVTSDRYVNAGLYSQMLLATLPAEGLKLYRERVDPAVRSLFEKGLALRDPVRLERVLRNGYVSSYGDQALLALGDMAWERAELARAKGYWEQILPPAEPPVPGTPARWFGYPDSDIAPELVRARLVLATIAQGDADRADWELKAFESLHPDAEGTLAGKTGTLVEILREVSASAADWPSPAVESDTLTFAGNPQRNRVLPETLGTVVPRWSVPHPETRVQTFPRRAGFQPESRLNQFPLVYGNLVLVNDADSVLAYDLQTGKPAWPTGNDNDARIYPPVASFPSGGASPPVRWESFRTLGVPRFTMTVADGRLYARMGFVGTASVTPGVRETNSRLVCLDLDRGEGKLLWETVATDIEERGAWSFEGSPVVSGSRLYVGLRRLEPQPQSNVACFDAETGTLLWNRKICSGVAFVAADYREVSHQLVTLAEGTLYYSTNLGAIAALDAVDGTIRWISTYERTREDEAELIASQMRRGLVPCVFHQGTVFAAPQDSRSILAYDAATGILKWQREFPRQVQWLLGVGEGNLIAAGDYLTAIDARSGRLVWRTGSSDPEQHTYGQGVLAGNTVLWPRHHEIRILDLRTGEPVRDPLPLSAWGRTGGHLALAESFLLVAEADRLVAYGAGEAPLPLESGPRFSWIDSGSGTDAGRNQAAFTVLPPSAGDWIAGLSGRVEREQSVLLPVDKVR